MFINSGLSLSLVFVVLIVGMFGCSSSGVAGDEAVMSARDLAISSKVGDVAGLLGYLTSADPIERRYALYGLQYVGDQKNVGAMIGLMGDDDRMVRLAAVEAVGKLRDGGAVDELVGLLDSEDVGLRFQVLMALGRIGDAGACSAMTNAFGDRALWTKLPTWDSMSLMNVIDAEFYTDENVVGVLHELLDYPNWDHSNLEGMVESRQAHLGWILAHRAAYILAMKYGDASGEAILLEGFAQSDYEMQDSARALAKLKSNKGQAGLEKMLGSRFMNTKMDAVVAMGLIGDSQAVEALEGLLKDEDVVVRRLASVSLKQIDGKDREVDLEALSASYAAGDGKEIAVPGGKLPPQFIVLGVDDCASTEGLESMLDICKTLDDMGSKAVFTMWVAPLSGDYKARDVLKQTLLYQKLFDYGCEFANHTLHHNPGGKNWSSSEPAVQIEEVEGCTKWLQDNVDGFERPFTIKHGGGGVGEMYDREFTNSLIAKQGFMYSGSRGQHANEQRWPYEQKTHRVDYVIETGMLDGNAPPVHAKVTNSITSDYPGRFDYGMEDGVAMWKSNFEYKYGLKHRPILAVNAFHDWGLKRWDSLTAGRLSHRNEAALLKAFLIDVLVTNRQKYPDVYCVTFRQVMEYSLSGGDVEKAVGLGNGQDSRR